MTLTYIYHSCFLIECTGFAMLFDYYQDAQRPDGKRWVNDYLLNRPGTLYVFCSHSHFDHFNPEIKQWAARKPDIRYLFARELAVRRKARGCDAVSLDPTDTYRDDRIAVEAFGSTDLGVSFLIDCEGMRIFHAGDLNNWHWMDESEPEESAGYERNYLAELELLAQRAPAIDLAMFPIDSRLGRDYMRGAEQFVNRIRIGSLLPMHFGEAYDRANAFAPIAARSGCRFLPLTHPGESFEL